MNPIKQRKRMATHRRAQRRKIDSWLSTGIDHTKRQRTDDEKAARKLKRRQRMRRKKRRGWA